MDTSITVTGAREHNLKNLHADIPKNRLVVMTGVSGSGKSSLAFDTIFAEGQRRYIESLSPYARQFLGQVDKPDVDSIEGLSPAIAIDQKTRHNNPRSTVGTVTEIHDHLRLLFGRVGHQHCPSCGAPVSQQTIDQMADEILASYEGKRGLILAPLLRDKKGEHRELLQNLKRDGFLRVRVDAEVRSLEEDIKLAKTKRHDIDLVVDRISVKPENRSRLVDSLSLALSKGEGFARFAAADEESEKLYAESLACPNGHGSLPKLNPKLFSFNSPQGACPECHGLGFHLDFSEEKLVPDPSRPLIQAIEPWNKSATNYYVQLLSSVARAYDVKPTRPWRSLSRELREIILYGSDEPLEHTYDSYDGEEILSFTTKFPGVIPRLRRKHKETARDRVREDLERYMSNIPCGSCGGARLCPEAMATTIVDTSIRDICDMPIWQALEFVDSLPEKLDSYSLTIVERVLPEIGRRLKFLNDVGLDYLTLSRTAGSLSGGESQRIRLATQIGSGLSGVVYVLDEPSIGLHQRDNQRLLGTLRGLRDMGNTVLVVEHDEETIREADWLLDIGPGAGEDGGNLVACGEQEDLVAEPASVTGRYLAGDLAIEVPQARRQGNGLHLSLRGANLHNLRHVSADVPLGKLVVVTGVSGSGKSTLVMDLLLPYLESQLRRGKRPPTGIDTIEGLDNLDKVIEIDQSPIGRTPHSNCATYTGAFTPIRELFAATPEAKMRGYGPGRFSFNVKGGRCEACSGQGFLEIEMNFLPSVHVQCSVCGGRRYTKETLAVKYRGYDIAEVLDMTVSQARETFGSVSTVHSKLKTMEEVGLGYIKLGQPAPTLSGGEAQRIKLASELCKRQTGKTLYVLDEPTTGLHWHDVAKLLGVLNQLVEHGNTVIVIEHNLDVVKQADWVLDMGPEGGVKGGNLVASGTPEQLASASGSSHTGRYLAAVLPLASHYSGAS